MKNSSDLAGENSKMKYYNPKSYLHRTFILLRLVKRQISSSIAKIFG